MKREIDRKDLTLSIDHEAGQTMQIDFAGKKMEWIDVSTGQVHPCEVLVAVLPKSHMGFAIAVPSQKTMDFIHGINQSFLFFGKLPERILSDNLKSYVTRADRYEPNFNQLCEQLGSYYQIELQATRVGKPKDKASVENMVSHVYRSIYGPLRNEEFHSIEELNEAIVIQVRLMNNRPFQKRPGSRIQAYEQFEKPVMRDLPSEMFEVKKITKAKVQRNYHVFVGEEKNYYSVPYRYVGKQSLVLYTRNRVEIFIDSKRIAIHDKLLCTQAYRHQTKKEHMPSNHREWIEARGYNGEYFLKQASKIGPMTHWAVSVVLKS